MAEFPTLRVKYSRRMQRLIQKELRRTGRHDWVHVGSWFLVDVENESTVHASGQTRKDMEMALQAYNNGLRKLRDE